MPRSNHLHCHDRILLRQTPCSSVASASASTSEPVWTFSLENPPLLLLLLQSLQFSSHRLQPSVACEACCRCCGCLHSRTQTRLIEMGCEGFVVSLKYFHSH